MEYIKYLYQQAKLPREVLRNKKGQEQLEHEFGDITEDTIRGNSYNRFIYLGEKESYTESYNLVAFQLVGGTFTFKLSTDRMFDYVYSRTKIEGSTFYNSVGVKLPEKVGDYHLYRGKYLTNEVTVHFPGVEKKE